MLSSLIYLFGDIFVAKAGRLGGEDVPCRNVKVKKKELAALMLTASFLALKEEGKLTLAPAKEKMLMFLTHNVVNVNVTGERPNLDGLEGAILRTIGEKDKNVERVVWRMLGSDSYDPWGQVIGIARRELLTAGLVQGEDRQGIGKILGQKMVPLCEQITPLEQQAREVKARLDEFQKQDPQLYAAVYKSVESGISSRVERDTSSTD